MTRHVNVLGITLFNMAGDAYVTLYDVVLRKEIKTYAKNKVFRNMTVIDDLTYVAELTNEGELISLISI